MGYDGGLLKVFRRYDDDRSGSITANEMTMMVSFRLCVRGTPAVQILTSKSVSSKGRCCSLQNIRLFCEGTRSIRIFSTTGKNDTITLHYNYVFMLFVALRSVILSNGRLAR